MRWILLIAMFITAVVSMHGANYFYECNVEENAIKDELRVKGIKGYAQVASKSDETTSRINVSSKNNSSTNTTSYQFLLEYNINYRPEDELFQNISFRDAYNGIKRPEHTPLPAKLYEFKYNAGSKQYHDAYMGIKVPIIFLPDKPGAVEVLNEQDEIRPNSRFFSTYFLAGFALLCFFLFFQYLITGKTI